MKTKYYRIALCALPVIALLAGCGDKSKTASTPSSAATPGGPVAGATNTQPGAKTNYTPAADAAAYQQKMGGRPIPSNAR